MNRVRKILLVLLVFATMASVISGCATTTTAPTTAKPAATTAAATTMPGATTAAPTKATTAAQKPVTLKFFSNEEVMKPKMDLIGAEYTKRNPNVKVEYIYIAAADFNTKVDTTILAGEQLDITYFNVKFDFLPRAEKGEFVALDPYLAAEGKKFEDLYIIDSSFNGKVYGLPGDLKIMNVWLNMDDLAKVGLKLPALNWTWDDYRAYAKKLTWGEGKDKHYGSFLFTWDHYNVLEAYDKLDGNPYLTNDGKLRISDPSFKSSLELRYNLEQVDKTSVPLSDIKALTMDYRTAFFSGKASMMFTMSNIIPQAAQTQTYPHTFVTGYAPMPIPVGGREGYCYSDNRFYVVGSTTVDKQAAYNFLRFFTTEGIPMKNVGFTSAKNSGVTNDQIIDMMVAEKKELYDVASLKAVYNNPKLKPNFWTYVPIYTGEIKTMYQAEAELAVLGTQTPDQAIANAIKKGEAILAKYK